MVLCIDEMGPVSAKSYQGNQGRRLVLKEPLCTRARQQIDYGLRGSGYVFGALWPQDGAVYTHSYERRISPNYVDFLHEVDSWVPKEVEGVVGIVDNLWMHRSMEWT